MAKNFIISYPRSGRAWMLSILKHLRCVGVDGAGSVKHSHDCGGDYCMHRYRPNKTSWIGHRVVLLTRDPRDIVVSHWHALVHRTKRFKTKWGDMSLFDWIQEPEGLDFPIRWLNDWVTYQKDVGHLRIRYEDLKIDAPSTISRAFQHWGLGSTSNLEKMHVVDEVTPEVVKGNWPHSNKETDANANGSFRRGESGVWREYFTDDQVSWINEKVQLLDPTYKEYRSS